MKLLSECKTHNVESPFCNWERHSLIVFFFSLTALALILLLWSKFWKTVRLFLNQRMIFRKHKYVWSSIMVQKILDIVDTITDTDILLWFLECMWCCREVVKFGDTGQTKPTLAKNVSSKTALAIFSLGPRCILKSRLNLSLPLLTFESESRWSDSISCPPYNYWPFENLVWHLFNVKIPREVLWVVWEGRVTLPWILANIPCWSNSLAIISMSALEFTVLFPIDWGVTSKISTWCKKNWAFDCEC